MNIPVVVRNRSFGTGELFMGVLLGQVGAFVLCLCLYANGGNNDDVSKFVVDYEHIQRPPTQQEGQQVYSPGDVEVFVRTNSERLGYNDPAVWAPGCRSLWTRNPDPNQRKKLRNYLEELDEYRRRVRNFDLRNVGLNTEGEDIRKYLDSNNKICDRLELHPNGLAGIFEKSRSELSYGLGQGYMEPLVPPMRHPRFCNDWVIQSSHLMDISYLVHDFPHMCRNLRPTSRTVLIDMGASLDFGSNWLFGGYPSPMVPLLEEYRKFGFTFDHVYAFEITPKDPKKVMELIPLDFLSSYHWFNVGVEKNSTGRFNPFHSLLRSYNENDFVVVKLDIDTPWLEIPLFQQLLENEENFRRVDVFYFEHHVPIQELKSSWEKGGVNGTLGESLDMFAALREKGVAAHSWV